MRVISNVTEQQKMVRGNMLSMIEEQAKTLRLKAREQISTIYDSLQDNEREREERRQIRGQVRAMFGTARISKKDAKLEDFEIKPGQLLGIMPQKTTTPQPGTDSDVEMGGMNSNINQEPRTTQAVREKLSRDLQRLVDQGTSELEAYDRHCLVVLQLYKEALERRTGKKEPIAVSTAMVGILKNRNVSSPVDLQSIRRSSTGQPFAVQPAPATRTFETIDGIARRGSTDK